MTANETKMNIGTDDEEGLDLGAIHPLMYALRSMHPFIHHTNICYNTISYILRAF